MDVLLTSIAVTVLFPFMLPIIIILRLTGEGEIFYIQNRLGKSGEIFGLYKFATMLKNSPNMMSGTLTIKDDPRVIPFGKFLRKTKINELPQLLNVLFGDMSLIGPRPMTPQTFSYYSQSSGELISKIPPGLSGVGSIVFRGEEDLLSQENDPMIFYANTIAPYKAKLEEWYVVNRSLGLYFLVIFLTIFVIIFPKSGIVWNVLKGAPVPPDNLRNLLNYT